MRRFVALLLSCVFALQATWAVAAVDCPHALLQGAQHHEALEHQGHSGHAADGLAAEHADEPPGAVSAPTASNLIVDCEACPACQACMALLPVDAARVVAIAIDASRSLYREPTPAAAPYDPLERPDWSSLA